MSTYRIFSGDCQGRRQPFILPLTIAGKYATRRCFQSSLLGEFIFLFFSFCSSTMCQLLLYRIKLNLSLFCKGRPKRRIGGLIGGVKILLQCVAGDIVDSSFDIRQLRHLDKAVSCHFTPICLRCPQLPAGAKYPLHKSNGFVQEVYFALSRRGLFIYSTLRTSL